MPDGDHQDVAAVRSFTRFWTSQIGLLTARHLYQAAGFCLIEEEPHHSYGHDLVGQTWAIDFSTG